MPSKMLYSAAWKWKRKINNLILRFILITVNSRGRSQSQVLLIRHLVSYMSVWHVQAAATIHLELRASIPNTYSVISTFTRYMVHGLSHLSCSRCLILLPSLPCYLIYAVSCIYFHLLPTLPVLTFFRFHVCNLGLPPPTIPLLLISSPKGPIFCRCPKTKPEQCAKCEVTFENSVCNCMRDPAQIWSDRKRGRVAGQVKMCKTCYTTFSFRKDKCQEGDIIM